MIPSKYGLLFGALALPLAAPAIAQDRQGSVQVKGFVTTVLPEGEITEVEIDEIGLPAGSDVRATDSVIPKATIEYFVTNNFSLETYCCVSPHDVRGTGTLGGAELINDAIILPATLTAKYHFDLGSTIKPYIGAGPAYFFIFDEGVGADAAALGATNVDLSDEFGVALQAGVDIALNDSGLGLSFDAKRYFIGTTATFRAGEEVALRTEHDLDPWILSGGLSYRF
ncbi:OmpW/AlkL family protein [Erythrobacter rubeus]|uniref:Outer membrane beta-barrel protein n=1 Tax=Erythrobacter rubeus TaxID=2760803 RepID=A0ABR8KNK3_9SPHN|nr:OmpW family outer membrane protein [Erythrobacter rubeus]MBD2840815.1 outer membrane beta-barrel protein [Erythrobacter rubeus]